MQVVLRYSRLLLFGLLLHGTPLTHSQMFDSTFEEADNGQYFGASQTNSFGRVREDNVRITEGNTFDDQYDGEEGLRYEQERIIRMTEQAMRHLVQWRFKKLRTLMTDLRRQVRTFESRFGQTASRSLKDEVERIMEQKQRVSSAKKERHLRDRSLRKLFKTIDTGNDHQINLSELKFYLHPPSNKNLPPPPPIPTQRVPLSGAKTTQTLWRSPNGQLYRLDFSIDSQRKQGLFKQHVT